MTLCPIAAYAGCQKCAVFKLCLVKGLIGDLPKMPKTPAPEERAKLPVKPGTAAASSKPRTADTKARGAVAAKPRSATGGKKKPAAK